jgi:ribonuclease J
MWVFEYGDDIIICDMGVMFPDSDLLGVDLVLPDISYLHTKTANIRGVFLTHGHEDHIGAVPWLIADLGFPPIYGTTLTLGLLQRKLKEHRLTSRATTVTLTPGTAVTAGVFTIEPFHIAHSIPDAVGFGITSPAGLALYITDWKLDHTPVDNWPTDLARLTDFGRRNPLVLVTDCVRVESPGYTPSERTVSGAFDQVFGTAPDRIIMATFAPNISRVQMVIDAAVTYGRKVVPIGRSMENNVEVARELGYLRVPDGVLIKDSAMKGLPDDQIAIVCTGSQGEPMAALSRLASRTHRSIRIGQGDTILVSSTPIPGNEVSVSKVIDNLYRLGADVIYGGDLPVHVSGHAAQEELKLLLNMVQPQYVVPFHGDYRHMVRYQQLAVGMGFRGERVLLAESGTVMEFGTPRAGITGHTP